MRCIKCCESGKCPKSAWGSEESCQKMVDLNRHLKDTEKFAGREGMN